MHRAHRVGFDCPKWVLNMGVGAQQIYPFSPQMRPWVGDKISLQDAEAAAFLKRSLGSVCKRDSQCPAFGLG